MRVFLSTGARLSEVANLRWTPGDETTNDLDLDSGIIRVMGKGRRERVVFVGAKAVKALDRYVRLRGRPVKREPQPEAPHKPLVSRRLERGTGMVAG